MQCLTTNLCRDQRAHIATLICKYFSSHRLRIRDLYDVIIFVIIHEFCQLYKSSLKIVTDDVTALYTQSYKQDYTEKYSARLVTVRQHFGLGLQRLID